MNYTKDNLRTVFQQPFSKGQWQDMLHNFFGATVLRAEPERIEGTPENEAGYYLGAIDTIDSYRIGLFCYNIRQGNVAHKRVGLRKLVKSFVNPTWGEFDAALVVFNSRSSWRLSFVSDIKGEATAPKRYTFVFGEKDNYYNTAVSRFMELQNKGISFANIKEAFSVEALTKEFYNKLYNWFLWAKDKRSGVTFPNNIDNEADDRDKMEVKMIRLITRMLFVWFIKQKHLVPGNLFDVGFLATVLRDFNPDATDNGDYYNAILQNLFFATLNQEIEGRKLFSTYKNRSQYYSNKQLYRDTDKSYFSFTKKEREHSILNLFKDIPYLNGGLFECLDKYELDEAGKKIVQVTNYDGFSHENTKSPNGNFKKKAFVPNVLFFAEEHHETVTIKEATNEKAEETQDIIVMGLIELFKQYNFTVEENTTSDVEVSLDPELLGRVFENLLAAYNPETQESARKSTGSYYTPREIVDYMVEESLIAYLSGECGHDEAEMRDLIKGDTHQPITNASKVIADLKNIKVLDPACGSGAFPMGILLKITDIIERLQPKGFNRYQTKLDIIKKCIYGIDIQPIAMLICKLRFFISLICDCEKDPSKPNFGIIPLPNLETKFVAANSLLPAKVKAFDNDWTQDEHLRELQKELLELRQGIFDLRTHSAKLNNKLKDREKCLEIKAYIRQNATKPNEEKLERLEKQIVDCEAQLPLYKDECWVEEMGSTQTSLFDEPQPTLFRKDVNKEKREKLQSLIRLAKAEKERELNKTALPGFEEAVDEVTEWDPYNQNAVSPFFDAEWMFGIGVDDADGGESRPSKQGFDMVIGNPPYIRRTSINDVDKALYEKEFVSATKQYDLYLLFIEKGMQMLTQYGHLCFINPIRFFNSDYGFGCRKYLIDNHKIKTILDISQLSVFQNALTYPCVLLVQNDKNNSDNLIRYRRLPKLEDLRVFESIKPILTQQVEIISDPEKRFIVYASAPIRKIAKTIDSKSRTIKTQFDVARGLANNKVSFNGNRYRALKSVNVRKYYIDGETRTIDTEFADVFKDEMIIMPRTVAFLQSMLKEKEIVCLDRIYYLTPKVNLNLKYLKFVLGVLNSRITNTWFEYYYLTTKVSGNYFDLNGNQIDSIPIPIASSSQQQPIITLVDKILSKKKANSNADTSRWEKQIDALLYNLYGLNNEEIKIIEGI